MKLEKMRMLPVAAMLLNMSMIVLYLAGFTNPASFCCAVLGIMFLLLGEWYHQKRNEL